MKPVTAPIEATINGWAVTFLTPDQAAEGLVLSVEAGWNQTEDDWRFMIGAGTAFGLRDDQGRLVATALVLPQGDQFAWISMVLVTPDCQRRGIAGELLGLCIAEIETRGLVAGLDATPAGRPIYQALGFSDIYGLQRLHCAEWRDGSPILVPDGLTLQPLTAENIGVVAAFDAPYFGGDRNGLLEHLVIRKTGQAWIATMDANGEIAGYVLAREGRECPQVGPLVAVSEDVALALVERALSEFIGPLYVDVADRHAKLNALLTSRGFVPQRPFTRMLKGRAQSFDDPARIFAIAGPELG